MSRWFTKYRFHVCGLVLVVSCGVFAGWYYGNQNTANLQQVIAETDRVDPGWRLEDWEAGLQEVPKAENAALVMIDVANRIAVNWPPEPPTGKKDLSEKLRAWPPEKQFDQRLTWELHAALAKVALAAKPAERLADLPRGRFPLHWTSENVKPMGGLTVEYEQSLLPVTRFLTSNTLLKAQQGDLEGALLFCRAALNAGRSFGDHLSMNSFLVRDACQTEALQAVERVVAQGEPSDRALEQIQKLLEVEDSLPLFRNTIRLERALGYKFSWVPLGLNPSAPTVPIPQTQAREVTQTGMLRSLNRALEIAKLPPHEQERRWQVDRLQEKQSWRPSPFERMGFWTNNASFAWVYVDVNLSQFQNVHKHYLAHQASLRCAIAAIAAERYRQAEGRWPGNLQALTPRFLKQVSSDPFVEGAVRLLPVKDGLVVYSIGIDGEDNRGNLSSSRKRGTDLGFRLWNAKSRRQAAD